MNDVAIYITVLVVLGFWAGIVYVTAKSAIAKEKSGWLWGILTIFPLGPLTGPLLLMTMSKSGTAASKGQLVGRTLIIAFLVFALLFRLVTNSLPVPNQLSADELAACLDLSEQAEIATQAATYSEAEEMWEFPSQESANEYNMLVERFQKECSEKTYDEDDLREMQRSFGAPQ